MAAFAFVKPLAGVGGHGFGFDVAAERAGQRRFEDDLHCDQAVAAVRASVPDSAVPGATVLKTVP